MLLDDDEILKMNALEQTDWKNLLIWFGVSLLITLVLSVVSFLVIFFAAGVLDFIFGPSLPTLPLVFVGTLAWMLLFAASTQTAIGLFYAQTFENALERRPLRTSLLAVLWVGLLSLIAYLILFLGSPQVTFLSFLLHHLRNFALMFIILWGGWYYLRTKRSIGIWTIYICAVLTGSVCLSLNYYLILAT